MRECRATGKFDLRADDDGALGPLEIVGYASTFEPYEMYGGPARGGWIEQIDRRAFDKTLRERPDLHLLINHEGMPLARTKSGTLKLSVDGHGLKVEAKLDRSDPDVQRLEPKMRRGDMDEMSFAFRVKAQTWAAAPGFEKDSESLRTILEVNLQKGDVSIVNWGANPTTTAEVLHMARKKRLNGRPGTLSLAQAESLVLVKKSAPPTVGDPTPVVGGKRRRLTLQEALDRVAADRISQMRSDAASDLREARFERWGLDVSS